MKPRRAIVLSAAAWVGGLLLGLPQPAAAARVVAFPGAVGQGAASLGGRGGDVYCVTTLEDYAPHKGEEKIPGSLRHALRSATGPRTIVFEVAGAIWLREPLEVLKDRITIAGQTSPGGVTLFGYTFEVSGAEDIVVRHLRVRCSDFHARPDGVVPGAPGKGNGDLVASKANAVQIGSGSKRVIFDHVSASWGMDETLSVTLARDVTVQNCLIAEALDNSLHAKGAHGYGSLVRGILTAEDQRAGVGGYTFYQNLWAHNRARNPSLGGEQHLRSGKAESERRRTDVNLLNCVVFDWSDQATHRSNKGEVRLNLIANYYINGPEKAAKYFFRGGGGPDSKTEVFQWSNRFDQDQDSRHNGQLVGDDEQAEKAFAHFDDDDHLRSSGEPLVFLDASTRAAVQPAMGAYQAVVRSVGASLWRDAIDERIVRSLVERGGGVIDSQETHRGSDGVLPGVDDLVETHRPDGYDQDRDGMADEFERSNGLDPTEPSDRNGQSLGEERDLPGLTNLEVYLDEIAKTSGAAESAP